MMSHISLAVVFFISQSPWHASFLAGGVTYEKEEASAESVRR